MERLESAFGGKDKAGFDISKYAERMREDDKKISSFWTRGNPQTTVLQPAMISATNSDSDSNASDQEKADKHSSHGAELEVPSDDNSAVTDASKNVDTKVH